jgi:3-hydroxyisobutyrate dehydrogenase-like beta-hydroxyacid dehydrogenase
MLNGDFTPEGRVRQTLKDVHLMLEQAERHGQSLPMLNVHCDVLEACVRAGEADLDNSAVINEIARRQGSTLSNDSHERPNQNIV